ncbi:uncharacterized protein C8orf74 homolog isoform X2 [Lissotriton helveticus]
MASLTAAGMQEVMKYQMVDGRQHLKKLLKWKNFDESRNLRQSILLDVIYESIAFAAKKGLPWSAVAVAGRLSQKLCHEIKGISVSEVIFCLKDKFQGSESELTANHRLILLNYFITLFIRHYHLYQFVLSQDQDVDQTFIKLEIQPPPQPPALMEGIDKDMWLYQQEIARLTSSEAEKRSNILFLRQIRQLEAEETLQKLYEDLKTQDIPSLDKQLLEKVVKDAIRGQVEIAKDSLQEEVKMTYEILELQLRKKSLKPPLEYPPSVSSTKASKAETVKKQRKSKSPKKNFWKKL